MSKWGLPGACEQERGPISHWSLLEQVSSQVKGEVMREYLEWYSRVMGLLARELAPDKVGPKWASHV